MKKSTNFEMFVEAKGYIDKHHSNNPLDFVTNVYIFYYMSGRFPNASMLFLPNPKSLFSVPHIPYLLLIFL